MSVAVDIKTYQFSGWRMLGFSRNENLFVSLRYNSCGFKVIPKSIIFQQKFVFHLSGFR
jgi:hypothetical protein